MNLATMVVVESLIHTLPETGVPAGYKLTEAGIIPEDWSVSPIGSIFDVSAGGDFIPALSDDIQDKLHPYPIYSNALTNRGLYGYCTYADHSANSITVTARGTLGVANYRDHAFTAIGRVLVLKPKAFIDGRFFAAFINTRIQFVVESTGVPQLTAPQISKYLLPVPPLPEQRAIAAALSEVDALIASQEQQIAKQRDLKTATMQQLLSGKQRLPGFSGEWIVKKFGEIALPRKDRVNPHRARTQEFCVELEHIEQGTGKLNGSTITDNQSSLKSRFSEGDVLFGKLRAYLRKYWLTDRPGLCSTEIWALVSNLNVVIPSFLFQIVRLDSFIEVASTAYGTHMPRSDWNIVKNFEVAVPSLEEQRVIATILSDMDAHIAALEAKRDKTKAIKQGMMQQLLTGRIRL